MNNKVRTLNKTIWKKFTLIVILLPICLAAISQSYFDSIALTLLNEHDSIKVKAYNNEFKKVMQFDVELTKNAADSVLFYAIRSNDKNMIARATSLQASYHFLKSELDTALVLYNLAIQKYEEIDSQKEVAGTLINVANCYGEKGDVTKAMETYLKSLRIQEEIGITGIPIAANLENIGITYSETEDHKKALLYYRRARAIYTELKDTVALSKLDFNISLKLFDIDSIRAAQLILDRLEAYHREKQNVYALTDVLLEAGKNYSVKGDLGKAEEMMLEALQLAKTNNDRGVYGIIYNKLMGLYLEKRDNTKAEKYAILSFEHTKKEGDRIGLITDMFNLSEIYENKKEYKKALGFHKNYHALHDSILGIEKLSMIEEMSTKYETEKKIQKIALLEEKDKRNKLEKYGLASLILLLLSILGISIYANKQRLFKNKMAKEKVDQELAFNTKELELRKQELTAYALQLAHKNEILDDVLGQVKDLEQYNIKSTQKIINTINLNKNNEGSWEGFRNRFTAIHQNFESNALASYPTITSNELRLMSLIKMSLSNKEIAEILNISPDGIKKARYRLRKKMNLRTGESLEQIIMQIV